MPRRARAHLEAPPSAPGTPATLPVASYRWGLDCDSGAVVPPHKTSAARARLFVSALVRQPYDRNGHDGSITLRRKDREGEQNTKRGACEINRGTKLPKRPRRRAGAGAQTRRTGSAPFATETHRLS